jgi:hypothetical protein
LVHEKLICQANLLKVITKVKKAVLIPAFFTFLVSSSNSSYSAGTDFKTQVHNHTYPTLTIISPTDGDTHTTSLSQLSLTGTAEAPYGRSITGLVWDNINRDEAGMVTISPASKLKWNTIPIILKPGENEILLTVMDSSGAIGTDRISVVRSLDQPVISIKSIPKNKIKVYDKYEIRFNVETVADNLFFYYDKNPPPGITPQTGITVEGIFTSPSGTTLKQPGFIFEEMTLNVLERKTHYEGTGNTYWIVRFSPQQVGEYAVHLRAEDSSGNTIISAGGFTALPPIKKGFIQVSPDDPRYFEFSNRDLFFPIGPAWGPNYAIYKESGINMERVWMAGQAAYSTNWACWYSTALQPGNEGFDNPLTFQEHYPSHELSREIYYPDGKRIWMGFWGDESFFPNLKSNTEYLIKLRLKTMDIVGPVSPDYPYGFMVKSHGWPGENIEKDLRSYPSMIPVINQNRNWHTIVTKYKCTHKDSTKRYLSLYLDNVGSGKVYIDQFSIKEMLPDGSRGGELIRHSKADIHTYVEQRPAAFFDRQIVEGERNGVYLKYVVQDKRDWVPNHLTREGIFHKSGDGYFQENGTKAKWLLWQWWRYLIARWGYSTAIHSWEICNEADPNDPDVYRQTQDFGEFMHKFDSHPHLVTTSFWCCWKPNFWKDQINYPDVDYADLHEYSRESNQGLDMVEFIVSLGQKTFKIPVGKPVMLGETGIGYEGQQYFEYLKKTNKGIWYHNILWAQLCYGSGISSPNYWWSQHLSSINRQQIVLPFYRFVSRLDINLGGYVDLDASVTNPNIRVLGQKNSLKGKAYLWVQNKHHNWHNVMGVEHPVPIKPQSGIITIRLLSNTDYRVTIWNTYNGELQSADVLESDASGDIIISIPNLHSDCAVKIEKTDLSG